MNLQVAVACLLLPTFVINVDVVSLKADSFSGMVKLSLGAFDNPHAFKHRGEIYTNYKLDWIKDDGCIEEHFEEATVEERLMSLLTFLAER